MTVGTVAAIWRYPIKSLRGEMLPAATIAARGVEGDRALALVDRATRKAASIKSPRLWGSLLGCQETGRVPGVTIILPEGRAVGAAEAAGALAALGRRNVVLATTKPEGAELDKEWPISQGCRSARRRRRSRSVRPRHPAPSSTLRRSTSSPG